MFLSIKKNLKPQLGVGEGVSYNPMGLCGHYFEGPKKASKQNQTRKVLLAPLWKGTVANERNKNEFGIKLATHQNEDFTKL